MDRALWELWNENPPGPVEYNGLTVTRGVRLEVATGDAIHIKLSSFCEPPQQIISVDGYSCMLRCNETEAEGMVISANKWDRYPDDPNDPHGPCTIRVIAAKKDARVWLGNSWINLVNGGRDYGMGNCGIVRGSAKLNPDYEMELRCSDGVGPADFDSLVYEYKIIRA